MSTPEPKVSAVKSSLLGGQLFALIWIVLGTVGFYLLNPLFGWLFLTFAAFSVYIIARRFMCSSCYNCKSCTKGLAKLSIMLLGANRIPGLSKGTIISLTIFLYVVLSVIPGFVLAFSLMQSFSLVNAVLLAGLLAVSVFGIVARIKKGDKLVTS